MTDRRARADSAPGSAFRSDGLPRGRAQNRAVLPTEVSVLIAGGGPFGLMLANELGRRGITVLLVDPKEGTTRNVQANATQARTMEHYRRLGFADEVRALGMPADFPTDIAYFTRFARYELARFSLPSARDARELVRTLSGSWSAAELPHRCNQKFIEPVLRRHAERLAGVSVRYGWGVTRFEGFGNESRGRVGPAAGGPAAHAPPAAPRRAPPHHRRVEFPLRLRGRPHLRCLLPHPSFLPGHSACAGLD